MAATCATPGVMTAPVAIAIATVVLTVLALVGVIDVPGIQPLGG